MEKNVGSIDKNLRIIAGVLLIVAAFLAPVSGVLRGAMLVVAIIALVTAFSGFCPLFTVLGISTVEKKKQGGE